MPPIRVPRWRPCLPDRSVTARPENRLVQPLAEALNPLQGSDWWPLLSRWRDSAAGQALTQAVDARVAAGATVYPSDVFRALQLTPRAQVRVLVLGQDPYHGPDQAEGLAFSVPDGQRCPPSLRNVFKELQRDLGLPMPPAGRTSLVSWAVQGVLLLNTSLTVEDGRPGSHAKMGWRALTDAIFADAVEQGPPKVFMLWGQHAQAQLSAGRWSAESLRRHRLLCSNHPSPLSALRGPTPFVGCGHFSRCNAWLEGLDLPPIHWQPA